MQNDKKTWDDSEYSKRVRVMPEDLDYLKATKGKKSIAGRLREILEDYKRKEVSQK